jgi:hypothetical protein
MRDENRPLNGLGESDFPFSINFLMRTDLKGVPLKLGPSRHVELHVDWVRGPLRCR